MKLIIAIMSNDDGPECIRMLNRKGFEVTRLATSGGFLRSGSTTLLCGVHDDDVEDVIQMMKDLSFQREEYMEVVPGQDLTQIASHSLSLPAGGAAIFVVNVEQFIKI